MAAPALSKHVMGLLDGPLLELSANDDIYLLVGWEMGHSPGLAVVGQYLLAFLAILGTNNCKQLWLDLGLLVWEAIWANLECL